MAASKWMQQYTAVVAVVRINVLNESERTKKILLHDGGIISRQPNGNIKWVTSAKRLGSQRRRSSVLWSFSLVKLGVIQSLSFERMVEFKIHRRQKGDG